MQRAQQINSSSSSSEAQTKSRPPIATEQHMEEVQVAENTSDSENDVQIVSSVYDSGHESIVYVPMAMETSSESEDEEKEDPNYDPKNKWNYIENSKQIWKYVKATEFKVVNSLQVL